MHRLKEQETIPAPSDVGGLNKFVENVKSMCGVDLESKKRNYKTAFDKFLPRLSHKYF